MANVELVYIPVDQSPLRVQISFVAGMTVANVLDQSGLLISYPELVGLPVGIFSRIVQLNTQVKSGDRIEIYRSLTLDPMETRRQRAKR